MGQQGTLTRVWAKRGTRPRAARDTRYEWVYIFGAVCPERATTAALVLPYVNTEAMNLHLAEIAKTVAPGAHALLVLDGAGWHGAKSLILPGNITLLTLPPYAPELNPTSRACKHALPGSGRKRLELPSGQQARHHRVRQLRRNRQQMLRRMELLRRRPETRDLHNLMQMGKGQ